MLMLPHYGRKNPLLSETAEFTNEMDSLKPDHELNNCDLEYRNLMLDILNSGIEKENRTGTKTISLFGPQIRFNDVGNKFPLISTKKVHMKSIIGELLWFLSGSTNKNELREKYGTTIWDEWGDDKTGEMGPIYGNQWVNWEYIKSVKELSEIVDGDRINPKTIIDSGSINQLQNIIDTLKTNPDDRRMIVSAWHVEQIPEMALPPCHWSYQFYSSEVNGKDKRKLDIIMNIRSWDVFLGGPFNIASYAILLMMMAQEVGMDAGDLIINAGDAHLYENHIDYVMKQLTRDSLSDEPKLILNPDKSFWDFTPEDFTLEGYNPHPNWKNVPIAI